MTDRLYIIMRSDLKMSRGKEIGQAVHAFRFMSPLAIAATDATTPIICVRADSEEGLLAIMAEASAAGGFVSPVRDAGHTHNAPGTLTCAAIWGPTGELLRRARLY